jgi:hypothetical protein
MTKEDLENNFSFKENWDESEKRAGDVEMKGDWEYID